MIIEKKHFEYLVNQHGRVAHEKGDFARWVDAYRTSLAGIFDSIRPALPARCDNLLDVGSGLGGIDITLADHYGFRPEVAILDGDEAGAEVLWSFVPHNSMSVARDFLNKNGVTKLNCIGHNALHEWKGEPFDLVVSFAAWGFHFHPGSILMDLKKHIHEKTVVIADIRKSKTEWLRAMVDVLGLPRVLERADKYVRVAFRA